MVHRVEVVRAAHCSRIECNPAHAFGVCDNVYVPGTRTYPRVQTTKTAVVPPINVCNRGAATPTGSYCFLV